MEIDGPTPIKALEEKIKVLQDSLNNNINNIENNNYVPNSVYESVTEIIKFKDE